MFNTKTLHPLEFNLMKKIISDFFSDSSESLPLVCVIQVSGGRDSMSLLHAVHKVCTSPLLDSRVSPLIHIVIHHVNHHLRGEESERDAQFVCDMGAQFNFPIVVDHLDAMMLEKTNKQNASRNLRKTLGQKILQEKMQQMGRGARGLIWTAHHARDQMESILLHLIRGSGLKGLQGMDEWEVDQNLYRPFLKVSYDEICAYQKDVNLLFREDSSNQEDTYTRNRLRRVVLPELMKINPQCERSFQQLSHSVREERAALETLISSKKFNILSNLTATEILRYAESVDKSLARSLSSQSLHNILHHVKLLNKDESCLVSKLPKKVTVPLKGKWKAVITPQSMSFECHPEG